MRSRATATTGTAQPVPSASHDMNGMTGMEATASPGSMSMDEMTSGLKGLSGDDFDKAFLDDMIAHHEGAIEMATLAQAQAKHQEVKGLAAAMIAAQKGEISQMEDWQRIWGY